MRLKMLASAVVMSLGLVVSASACPKHEAAAKNKKVVKVADKVSSPCSKPCGKSAVTVSDKVEDGRSETAAKAPCHKSAGKSAVTVAAEAGSEKDCTRPCCKDKKAKTVSAKAPCHGSAGKSVVTASAKAPCHGSGGKSVVTASAKAPCGGPCGKDCDKPCCKDKKAKTVSAKAPCHKSAGKSVVTAAAKGGCSKPCGKSALTAAGKASPGKSADGGCPIAKKVEAVLASMPAMTFRVGDEVTCCSKSAAAMAEASKKPIEFVVGDETFKTEGEAKVKLTALLDREVEAMQTIQFVAGGKCSRCPVTAKNLAKETGTKMAYRVGGVDFNNKADAEKVVKLVSDAVSAVAMEYKVDGKTFKCSKSAGAKCKESGKKLTYVVGDEETGCRTTAKMKLAETKLRKIVEAAAAASFSL